MTAKQALEQELALQRSELKGIESEIARLTDRRFDKLSSLAKVQQDLDRERFGIPAPSAALRQFEADRENQAVGE
jgi:hypothetical protein